MAMSVVQQDTSPTRAERRSEDDTIGIICALPTELAAATEMLDEEHPSIMQNLDDENYYQFGRIGGHDVVIGALPCGSTGPVSAAGVALNMKSTFRNIRIGLMVGIGGGVPSEEHDIRLGDVVVSQPEGQYGGVVQHDSGKFHPERGFERTGSLNRPPTALLYALSTVRSLEKRKRFDIATHLTQLSERLPDYGYPSGLNDSLYQPDYVHKQGRSCSGCGPENLIQRKERHRRRSPVTHYGTIASGSQVVRDAIVRDKTSRSLGGVLCFEMEAAGLMNNFPCLVIRGISDYSDSHKNDGWHDYAAATAAAFAKELLNHLVPARVAQTQTISQAMDNISSQLAENMNVTQKTEQKIDSTSS
jgi:nucleoside phosphorylase